MLQFTICFVVIFGFSVYEGQALQCWACSSDIDRSCGDRFNISQYGYGYGGGAYYNQQQPYNQQPLNQQPYDPYNPSRTYDNRDHSTYRSESNPATETYRDYNRDPNRNRDPNYRGPDSRHPDDRVRYNNRPYDDRDTRYRDYNNNNTRDSNNTYDRFNNTGDYGGYFRNGTNGTREYYDRDRDYQNHDRDYQNRDRDYQNRDRDRAYDNRGDYNNRDPNNRNRDPNGRDNFDRDRDYRNRDYNSRDPNPRDPYFDRDRNRDPYNRDYNNRDNNRDPNLRDPYVDNRDPNNRDYPPRDYNNQGRNYNPNYPNREPAYQAQLASQSGPRLVTCNEEEARLRRMRNVCIKKVQRIGDYQLTYIRRCELIPLEKEVGTCYDAVSRGISLDFCEYCEYDGCNSASGLKFNVFVACLVPLGLLWSFLS